MTKVKGGGKMQLPFDCTVMDDEHRDYLECKETWDWDYEQLKHHIYMSLERLEIDFLKGEHEKIQRVC